MPGIDDTIAAEEQAGNAAMLANPNGPPEAAPDAVRVRMGGQMGAVPRDQLDAAVAQGAEDVDGGLMGTLTAAEVGFGKTVGGGLIPGAAHLVGRMGMGDDWAKSWKQNYDEESRALAARHPVASGIGSGAGFLADMAGPLGKIGKGATKLGALAGDGALGVAGRIGAAAAGNVATMGAYNAGEQISQNEMANDEDSLAGDPSNFEKIFAAAGKDALLNAAVGGGLHGMGELWGAARKSGGLLSSLPKKAGPVSAELADQVAGVPGAGIGVREEAKAGTEFIDKMTAAGATREQAATAWHSPQGMHDLETSFFGDKIRGASNSLSEKAAAGNPAMREALREGAAHKAMSATEGEAFRASQIEKFTKAGDPALKEIRALDELTFGMKHEQVLRTINPAWRGQLDAINGGIRQEAQEFLQHWTENETGAGGSHLKNFKGAFKQFQKNMDGIAERAMISGAENNADAAAQMYREADTLKRSMGKVAKARGLQFGEPALVSDAGFDVAGPGAVNRGARATYERMRLVLEDANTFGQTGQLQAGINAPFASGITNANSALGKLTTTLEKEGFIGIPQIHSAKAASFLDAAGSAEGKTDTESLLNMMDNYNARADSLIKNAALTPAELATVQRGKDAMAAWRKVATDTIDTSAANARIKRMVMDEGAHSMGGHGIIGSAIGAVSDQFLNPIKAQMAREHLAHTVDRVSIGAKKAINRVMGWGEPAAKQLAPDATRAAKEIEGVKAAASSPEVLAARTSDFVGADTHQIVPRTAAGVAAVASRAVSYLASVAPIGRSPQGLLGGKGKTRYSDQELAMWHRASGAVKDPTAAVEAAKAGTLSREGVKAIKFVYPQMYQQMQDHAMSELADMEKRGTLDKMPYEQKIVLGTLLSIPSDGTMEQKFIAMMQASKQAAPDKPQDGQGGGGPKQVGHRPMAMNTSIYNTAANEPPGVK